MAKINGNGPPPGGPLGGPKWPWGTPRTVRERLVDRSELDRKKRLGKKGDPKNPALASAELLDFIGPAHSSDELRLPPPPYPAGHDADLVAFNDAPHLESAAERADVETQRGLEKAFDRIQAAPERIDRLKGLLAKAVKMTGELGKLNEDIAEIRRMIRQEQETEGY
jgi:hypothetical protein